MSDATEGDDEEQEGAGERPTGAKAATALPEVRSRLAAQSAAWNAGMLAERQRIRSIVEHEEAKGREPLALVAALDALMTPEEAVAMLRCAGRNPA